MYRRARKGWLKHMDFMFLDMLSLEASFLVSYWLRNGFSNPYAGGNYRVSSIILILVEVFVLFFFDSFKNVLRRSTYKEFSSTVGHTGLVILLGTFCLYLGQVLNDYSRSVMILTLCWYMLLSFLLRICRKEFLKRNRYRMEKYSRSLMIVTASPMLEDVIRCVRENNYEAYKISGVALVDVEMKGETLYGIPIVAGRDDLLEYPCREWVDEILIDLPETYSDTARLVDHFIEMGITVHTKLVRMDKIDGRSQSVERFGRYTVLTSSIKVAATRQAFVKRVMDICGGLVGCAITAVLFVIVGPMIYIKSPGPIFFSQIRVGKNGRKFRIYKFRSMYLDAEERKKDLMAQNRVEDGLMFKLDWDPRIIGSEKGPGKGIGNFIRKYSIDEFPQFFNVLKGDMSLVGTRPPTLDEWEKYELHHRARLAIKPGVTGMWQVSGRSEITDFEEVVALDKKYILEWNLGLDIKILFKTVFVVFGRKGAL